MDHAVTGSRGVDPKVVVADARIIHLEVDGVETDIVHGLHVEVVAGVGHDVDIAAAMVYPVGLRRIP